MSLNIMPDMQGQEQMMQVKKRLDKVRHRIAVVSGKGGVGKTTVAVYMAAALARSHNVALVDADIDCSNAAKMLGVKGNFETQAGKLLPLLSNGIKVASMEFLPKEHGTPIMWRGAIIHKAILQLISLVEWGELDYMIFDMPPGTSDAALTVAQNVAPDFYVVVTAPTEVSVMDARKAANMAMHFGVRFGIVENMSGGFFGKGGGEKLANELEAPFLGRVSMNRSLAEACDEGKISLDGSVGKEFGSIVEAVKKILEA